jgi:hypothetical protein
MNLRYTVMAAMLLASAPAYAAPGDMSVAAFLAKADALRARGAMALFSSDYKLLKGEGTAAGQAYRARLIAERAEGKPSSCPPRPAPVNSDNLLAHMRSYPAADQARITINTAMADLFIKTWPCR